MSLSEDEKHECEKLFKFLDKDKDQLITARELIIGLGVLGKTFTITQQKKIKYEYPNCQWHKPRLVLINLHYMK